LAARPAVDNKTSSGQQDQQWTTRPAVDNKTKNSSGQQWTAVDNSGQQKQDQ